MATIGRDGFTDPVVSVRPQQGLHDVFDRRPDDALHIGRFARIVSERTQRGQAACDNARLRIDKRSIEVQQYGAGRGHARP